MTSLLGLAIPNFSKQFVVEYGVSSKGIREVLLQEGRPLTFISQSLYERRELMEIVVVVQRWKCYLIGHKFIIKIDQMSLKLLIEQRLQGEEQHKLISKLIDFNFEIQYKPKYENKWEKEIVVDGDIRYIMQELVVDPLKHLGYQIIEGKLFL
ncbi:Retrovirus-related Pol polyprotein from transposon 17.6, partial [Mucuna pruriens]